MLRSIALFVAAVCGAHAQPRRPADLILRNGKIVTLDAARPQAEALAAGDGRILAVGNNREILALAGPATRMIDLEGRLAIPGFIEGHGHFMGLGQSKMNLNLRAARSWDAIVAMVAAAAREARPGEWILGRGWHQEKWDASPRPNVEGFPVHESLSQASPRNPVLLTHASGHAAFVNAMAMQLAGVDAATRNPRGGEILKDARGRPTGLLRETAQGLVRSALARDRARRSRAELEAEARQQIGLAMEECLSNGITSFQDAGSSPETVDLLRRVLEEKKDGSWLRLWVMLRAANEQVARVAAQYRAVDPGGRLTVRAIKRSMDGALGPRGAWLLAPYSDLPSSTGLNTDSVKEIAQAAEIALRNGYQLCVHAIGDRANREVLNLYEKVFRDHPEKKDLRWRIEHAQHLNAADIPRFAKLGVIASMQGIHCTSDAPYVIPRLGPARAEEGAYVWQKLMRSGAVVTNGTDAPVEDVSPIASFYASVSRKLKDGAVFYPAQRMSRLEALRSYTIQNAFAAFEEDSKGTLAPGKLADMTVLSKDILSVPEDEIPSAEVVYTIVGGKVMYQARALSK